MLVMRNKEPNHVSPQANEATWPGSVPTVAWRDNAGPIHELPNGLDSVQARGKQA